MPLHPKTPSSLASFKSRLVLPFRYWLTQVVLQKSLLNGCNSSSSSSSSSSTWCFAAGGCYCSNILSENFTPG